MSDAELPSCPECAAEFTYEQGAMFVCPMCGHEWASAPDAAEGAEADPGDQIVDSAGNVLADGDTVTVTKTVKIKGGGGGVIKAGTKVRDIRLNPGGAAGHDIDANVPGIGRMQLKSSVVKKAG